MTALGIGTLGSGRYNPEVGANMHGVRNSTFGDYFPTCVENTPDRLWRAIRRSSPIIRQPCGGFKRSMHSDGTQRFAAFHFSYRIGVVISRARPDDQ